MNDAAVLKPPLGMDGLREVLATAIRAGQLMAESGAATFRVEEVMHRLGTALGADWMDIYVTPTGIIAMATSHGEHRTRVMRVSSLAVNFDRVHAIYLLVARVQSGELGLSEVNAALDRLAARPRLYSANVTAMMAGIACGCFALVLRGGWHEAAATLIAAAAAQRLRAALHHFRLGPAITTLICAASAAILGMQTSRLLAAKPETVLLASVLFLVPGVFLVGSISDLISGNLISGVARGAYAVLVTGAIGAGLWIALLTMGVPVP